MSASSRAGLRGSGPARASAWGRGELALDLGEGPHHVLNVLVGLLAPQKEEVGTGNPVLLGRPEPLFVRDVRTEARRDAVVDDLDPVRRDAEVVDEVALAVVRDGDDAVGPPEGATDHQTGVDVGGAAGQELRIQQVDDVVDRDDRASPGERGKDVVRRMEEVEPVPPETPRETGQLGQRIARRVLGHGREVVGQVRERFAVRGADVNAEAIPARLGPPADGLQEVADVGPDPEVLGLAGIDADQRRKPSLHGAASSAASASTAAVARAAAVQENSAARGGPASRRRSRTVPSSSARSI